MTIYTDGYTIGKNPSLIGGGFVIMDEELKILCMQEIRKPMTNNEAELLGILKATELAKNGDEIVTDSMNSLQWVMNRKCKARPDLKPQAQQAYINILEKKLKLVHRPRQENIAGNYIEFTLYK